MFRDRSHYDERSDHSLPHHHGVKRSIRCGGWAGRKHLVCGECQPRPDRNNEHCRCDAGGVPDENRELQPERDHQRFRRQLMVSREYGLWSSGEDDDLWEGDRIQGTDTEFRERHHLRPGRSNLVGQCYPNSLARVSTEGVVSMVPFTTPNACVDALTVGPDHKIWADEGVAGALGRLSAIGGTGQSFTATHGVEFTGEVASFVDGTPTATASNFTATINWGDKTTSTGTVTGSTGGPFAVSGSHTYSKAGTFEPYVTFYDTVDNSTYTSSKGKAKVNS